MAQSLVAEHGIVCRLPGERLGYFGWPTVARLEDGRLMVASSGLRSEHVCPWGKTVLNVSTDEGRTWSAPRVIQDSAIDDRDAGITDLGGGHLIVTWFRIDTREYVNGTWPSEEERNSWRPTLATWTDEQVDSLIGAWAMLSADSGATWTEPLRVPVTSPHGPIRLRSGEALYLGKKYGARKEVHDATITAFVSADKGRTWEERGTVPCAAQTGPPNYHEAHVVELPSGRLVGMIRIENHSGISLEDAGIPSFSMMQTESDDGGRTWTTARPLGFHGSPPHLLRHSSGVLVLTYGFRQEPYGQRVAFSHDDGATWEHDWVIRDDGPDGDLGYPSTVEMPDGSLFTVAYQKVPGDEKCSLLWSRWSLPG